jgi:N6-adenosine-specific RNA methylase IME4
MPAILRYDAACRAVAEAKNIDEAKGLADKAEAVRIYARQAKNKQLEIDAAEIRLRAERRLGELLAETERNRGLSGSTVTGSGREPVKDTRPTLAELGISKKLSMQCQQLAAVPAERFEADLGQWRERVAKENERVTMQVIVKAPNHAERRAQREAELGARQRALPDKKYGVIYCDYPRRFNVFSRETGLGRSPDNIYPTMTFRQIVELPVPELAAPDCALFMWSTGASLLDDLEIMAEWGFVGFRPRDTEGRLVRDAGGEPLAAVGGAGYRSHQVWLQDKLGLGYWFRDIHEILLVGARGAIVAPAPGTQDRSVIAAPLGRHSAKPAHFAEMIERLFPSLPKVELFARVARPGWDRWGYEAPEDLSPAAEEPAQAGGPSSGSEPARPTKEAAAGRLTEKGCDGAPAAAAGEPADDDLAIPNFLRVGHPENTWRKEARR